MILRLYDSMKQAHSVRPHKDVISLGAMIATPLGFLAGAFIPLPQQIIGTFGERTYQLYDLLPWTHAVASLRSVLTYGTGLSTYVVLEISWLAILTAILFVAGVVIYSRARLRAGK